jgi:hypothetical protein
MTKKIDFKSKWFELVEIVVSWDIIPDVTLMELMEFSPTSWKIWKSKFDEKSKIHTEKYNNFGKEIMIEIKYIKKEKKWTWKEKCHIQINKIHTNYPDYFLNFS